jgi:hypothetical protein
MSRVKLPAGKVTDSSENLNPISYLFDTGVFFSLRVNRPERAVDSSPLSNVEVKNVWIIVIIIVMPN